MAVALASGSIHTCALISDRTVKCWGDNPYGQLGDGSTGDRDTPVEVSGLIGNVTAIATGLRHTCAVTDAGGVECWGRNNWGQLGDESLNDRLSPVAVRHLPHKAAAIAAGSFHTCALSTEGGVMCWGDNDMNQLGGATADSYSDVPLDVPSLTQNVVAITAGAFQTCALTSDGGVKCWGETNSTPVDVPGLTRGVIAVSSGFFHSCAITASGGVLCWGDNSSSQLGDGSNTDSSTPVQVSGLPSGISAISAGALHTCALSSSGGVMCWGDNSSGQLGNGTMTDSAMPVAVTGLSNGVTAVASGSLHSCALEKTGDVKCWGKNISGQLGNSSRADSMLPVDVEGLGDE